MAYKYNRPFNSKIFKYRQLAFSDISGNFCNYQIAYFSNFINKFYGYILTGDLNIVENKNVLFIMSFGTNFHLNSYLKSKMY